jgi:hypothetical protein
LVKPVLVTELFEELMKHLKYRPVNPEQDEKPIPETSVGKDISDLPGLINSLEYQYKDISEKFEFIQPIDEITDIGNQLVIMGMDHNSAFVKGYGEELLRAAGSFNIDAIIKLIGNYTGIVNTLKELPESQTQQQRP